MTIGHFSYTLAEVAKITGGELVHSFGEVVPVFTSLLTDSRQLASPDNTLFFAIKTARNDGHRYIAELVEKGVKCFVVSKLPEDIDTAVPGRGFVILPNPMQALQLLASYHRQRFSFPVVGITGSNGKTVVKEWVYQLLSEHFAVVRSPKSYNSQIGVPLSVWQMDASHQYAVFEAGISEPGEMELLKNIIRPDVGLFTNLGPAHSENFINQEQKAGEKLKLFVNVETLVYCLDHAAIQAAVIKSQLFQRIKLFTWSKKQQADLQIVSISKIERKTIISGIYQSNTLSIEIPFTDDASVENAIHCWSLLLLLGLPHALIADGMPRLNAVAMRLELKEGINNCTLINDTYNSDFQSLSIALDFLNQQKQHRGKTLILSDIFESGVAEDELYRQIAALIEGKGVNRLIGIGPAISRQAALFQCQKQFFVSTSAFIDQFLPLNFQHQTILLKGARAFGFERISQLLQQKAHETVLEINLNGLIANLNYYRSKLHPDVKIMLMVKAFGYGSGSFEIASALQFHQVDYLAVAYADEGVELRKAGIQVPIMVMSPDEHSFDTMLVNKLEPEIFSFRTLQLLIEAMARQPEHGNMVPIHLKFDTGMRRLGFEANDVVELVHVLKKHPALFVKSVFSHLAASDKPEHDAFTNIQIATFIEICGQLKELIGYNFDRHMLNSAGINRFSEAHFEMVRLGIGLYGVNTTDNDAHKLSNVAALKTIVSQLKTVKAGQSIGYNRSSFVQRDSLIGVIPIGYADGFPRALSNGIGSVFIKGTAVPVIGDVCMDMCMIDVTDVHVQEGDEVIVFDHQHSVSDLARAAGTIPYEILTRISRRVKRVYFQE